MFTPESMEHLHIVFYKRDVEPVADALVRQGAMQMVDAAELEEWAGTLQKAGSGEESAQLRQWQEKLESLFHQMAESPNLAEAVSPELNSNEMNQQVKHMSAELEGLLQMQEEAGRELNRLKELLKHLEETPNLGLNLDSRDAYSYLAVETGRIADENLDILKKFLESTLHVLSSAGQFGGLTTVVVVSLRRDREKIQRALRDAGSQPFDSQKEAEALAPEAMKGLEAKVRETLGRFEESTGKIDKWKSAHLKTLSNMFYQIKREVLKQQILKYFRKTEHTYLISGWIPQKERDTFVTEIRRATQNRCIIERSPAESVEAVKSGKIDVPVKMQNSKFFKPFELITGAYGLPAYRTIDPTPILGLSFMFMFGMMFGDVGHGLVLLLLGIMLLIKGKSEIQNHAGLLICYVGSSSMLFGFLFGSLFGFENLSWLPPLWLRPMESISELFRVCIYFGIGMIFLSMAINIINAVRLRRYLGILFDNAGFFAALFYWSGIVLATRVVTSSTAEKDIFIISAPVLMITALVLLFFREPIIHLAQGKKKLYPEGPLTGLISGLIELMEITLGFLANTVSFIRIAAFGLVHAGLAMAIFALSESVSGFGSVVIIIFGNIFIITMEGLVVIIQSVRLEFYEFFSRFFREGKVGYVPLRSQLLK